MVNPAQLQHGIFDMMNSSTCRRENMSDKHIHLIPKPVDSAAPNTLVEMVQLEELTKSEPAAADDILITLCCPPKIQTASMRYWDGVKQYRRRMRIVPVKRVFSPIA
jgi:hypothetical protein